MSPEQINDIANWIAIAAVIPFAGYWATYGLGSAWWNSLLGWVMFALGAAMTVTLGYVAIRRAFGDFFAYQWWSIGIYTLLNVVGWALWAIVIVERRRSERLQIPLKKRRRERT